MPTTAESSWGRPSSRPASATSCPITVSPILSRQSRRTASGILRGRIAQEIGTTCGPMTVFLSADDLAAHTGEWVEPLRVPYRGRIIVVPPPPRRAWRPPRYWDPRSPRRGRFEGRSVGYVDTLSARDRPRVRRPGRYLADPAFHEVPTSEILDPEYLAACAARTQATGNRAAGEAPSRCRRHDVQLRGRCAGHVAAVVQSLYWGMGLRRGGGRHRRAPAESRRVTSHWTRATATACSPASDPPAR
ncbi:hypothetical protein GS528_17180 [Rhodococcus hoagii]|nr:hypothetical protein [Prescottella equi]